MDLVHRIQSGLGVPAPRVAAQVVISDPGRSGPLVAYPLGGSCFPTETVSAILPPSCYIEAFDESSTLRADLSAFRLIA